MVFILIFRNIIHSNRYKILRLKVFVNKSVEYLGLNQQKIGLIALELIFDTCCISSLFQISLMLSAIVIKRSFQNKNNTKCVSKNQRQYNVSTVVCFVLLQQYNKRNIITYNNVQHYWHTSSSSGRVFFCNTNTVDVRFRSLQILIVLNSNGSE